MGFNPPVTDSPRATIVSLFDEVERSCRLRVVSDARNGSSGAFPSRTAYLRRDPPDDLAGREAAEAKMAGWRKAGRLPFPHMASGTTGEQQDKLPYPAKGSAQRAAR